MQCAPVCVFFIFLLVLLLFFFAVSVCVMWHSSKEYRAPTHTPNPHQAPPAGEGPKREARPTAKVLCCALQTIYKHHPRTNVTNVHSQLLETRHIDTHTHATRHTYLHVQRQYGPGREVHSVIRNFIKCKHQTLDGNIVRCGSKMCITIHIHNIRACIAEADAATTRELEHVPVTIPYEMG